NDVNYQLPPYKSQVIKLNTNASPNGLSSLLFSWQSGGSDASKQSLPSSTTTLFDETTWATNSYAPMLRLTLYPIPVSNQIKNLETDARTFFLYPTANGGTLTTL